MVKFLVRIILVAVFVSILLVYINPISFFFQNDLQRIEADKKIVFVTRLGPTTLYESKNRRFGYHYSLMNEFAEYLGVELEVKVTDNINNAIQMLENRQADIISGFDIEKSRPNLKFSYPYNRVDHVIVSNNKNTRAKSYNELLSEYKVYSIDSDVSKSISIIENDDDSFSIEIIKDTNIDELVKMLNDDEVKFIIMNSDEYKIFEKYFNSLTIIKKISLNQSQSWVLSSNIGKKFENKITDFFKEQIKDNNLSAIYSKFFRQKQHSFVGTKIFLNDLINIFPRYEFFFKEASKMYEFDWRLIASIGYQESRWRHDAVSYTGVRGIMMLTQDTAKEMNVIDREDPRSSIYGGTKYLRDVYRRLPSNILIEEKKWFAIASYNIGLGHINDAIKLAKDDNIEVNKWVELKPYILKLSQSRYYRKTKYGYARGWETVKYVENIKQYYDILVFLDSQDQMINPVEESIPNTL